MEPRHLLLALLLGLAPPPHLASNQNAARHLLLALILGLAPPFGLASNQNPKLYVQTDLIGRVEPLRNGFSVQIPKDILNHQLHPKKMPTVYYAAVSLNPHKASFRDMTVDEDKMRNVHISDLEFNSWYYVCIEFENQDRVLRKGNFSTVCTLHRTLDKYGNGLDSTVIQAQIRERYDTQLVFDLQIEVDFPMRYDIYLEEGPRIQSYIISKDMPNLRVVFSDLVPGFFYGHLCVIEKPLIHGYTCMGRSIDAVNKKCFFGDLVTIDKVEKMPIGEARQMRNAVLTNAPTASARAQFGFAREFGVALLSVLVFVL